MKSLTMPLLSVALLATPLLSSAALAQDDEAEAKQQTVTTVNTMRKALVISINRELAAHYATDEDDADDDKPTTVRSGTTSYVYTSGTSPFFLTSQGTAGDSRGHYIPGHGAIFSMDLVIPRVAVEVEKPERGDGTEKDDIWAEAEGRSGVVRSGTAVDTLLYRMAGDEGGRHLVQWTLDEDGVNAAVQAAVKAAGDFGLRVSGVGADESIIVAIDVQAGAVLDRDRVSGEGNTMFYNVVSTYGSNVGGRKIVIEVPVSAIRRYSDDQGSVEALMSRAKITTYELPGTGSYSSIAPPAPTADPAPTRPRVDRAPGSSR